MNLHGLPGISSRLIRCRHGNREFNRLKEVFRLGHGFARKMRRIGFGVNFFYSLDGFLVILKH